MPLADHDPKTTSASQVGVAADRRRPGRDPSVRPELIPLLRGQLDVSAPADPHLPPPRSGSLDRTFLLGTAVISVLMLAGGFLRFVP